MVGIYCRISKRKLEGQDVSIEVQKKNGIKFANSIGKEYQLFIDEGISGTKDEIEDRPEFASLLDYIKRGLLTEVYCIDQSRIERNPVTWGLFTYEMQKAKCKYYPNGVFVDLEIPENQLYTDIVSATNKFYAKITGKKVKLAINTNAKKGKTHGLTAYGYGKDEKGYFKIIEEEATIIRRIFDLSLEGNGSYTIANILNKEGVPTKFNRFNGEIIRKEKYTNNITRFKKDNVIWRGNVIHDMIKNPIYKGERQWKSDTIQVPAIVEKEHWDKVNANLVHNKKKAGRRDEYHYLLNGLIFCHHCGHEFRGKKRLKGRDLAYKCKGIKRHDVDCPSRGISIPKLETFIIYHLFKTKDLQDFLTGIKEDVEVTGSLKKKLHKLKNQLLTYRKAEDKAYNLLLDPFFEDDERVKQELKRAKEAMQHTNANITVLENKIIERENGDRAKRVKRIIGEYSLNAGFETTKKLVHSLIKRITIKHVKKERGGYYLLEIEYVGFEESSVFMTIWGANKWYWLSHYRQQAKTEEELQDDKDLLIFLQKQAGKKEIVIPDDFQGFETYSSPADCVIDLKHVDLIHFD